MIGRQGSLPAVGACQQQARTSFTCLGTDQLETQQLGDRRQSILHERAATRAKKFLRSAQAETVEQITVQPWRIGAQKSFPVLSNARERRTQALQQG